MKKFIIIFLAFILFAGNPVNGQGGLLKKVAKSMSDEILGKPQNKNADMPEPASECDKPELIMDLGGKLSLDYTELSLSISDDGRILARHRGDYYIVQNAVTTGPFKDGDKRLEGFEIEEKTNTGDDENKFANNPYISNSGDKYLITFGGKKYGPYAEIAEFTVSKLKDKFVAIVVENVMLTEKEAKKMEEALNNAKTDQEKMDISLKIAQEMGEKMTQNPEAKYSTAEVITNIEDAKYNIMQGGTFSVEMKYNDILINMSDKVIDLQGKTIITFIPEINPYWQIFISTDNKRFAGYSYGKLIFNDKITLPELFNPHLLKESGQVYLAYMYYSPKKNSILQCRIPF